MGRSIRLIKKIVVFSRDELKQFEMLGKFSEKKYPNIVDEVRGAGLLKGLKMLVDNTEFIKKLMDHKMLTVKAEENVIRLFPPLTASNKELDEAASKIEKVCEEMN